MALQTSGAISLANIQTEFGGNNPISLSEYYGVASGVPGSGTISLGDFYGKSAGMPDGTYYALPGTGSNVSGNSTYFAFGPYATANAGFDVRVVRESNGFSVFIDEAYSAATTTYRNTSNTGNVTISGNTAVRIFQMTGSTIDAIKIVYSTYTGYTSSSGGGSALITTNTSESPSATYNSSSNVWQTLNGTESVGRRFYASAFSGTSSGGSSSAGGNATITVYARKSGLPDKLMCTFKFNLSATAEWSY